MNLMQLRTHISEARSALLQFEAEARALEDPGADGRTANALFSAFETLDQSVIEIQADLHPLEGLCK